MDSTTEIEGLVASLKGKSGYLPCQFIEMALKEGMIHSQVPIEASQIQPVSLDLRLGQKAYRIQCSFLPENDPVETRLKDVTLYEFDISNGGILEKNAIYLIPLMEELNLPPEFYGLANPKSSTGRLDMFSRYVHYLSEFHGELGNFVEAAIVLLSHAELCSWSVEDQCEPLGSLFPRQSHFERKEEIVLSAIDLFHHGRYWERAIDLIHQLKEQYESSIYDYRKLSVILRREADMRESIIDRDRFFSTYFRVAFYGRGFSAEYMNKEFVYKGAELERVAEFVGRIMSKFPNCEKMNASDVPSDDIINGSGRYIQIHTCLPVPSPAVMAHDERPLRIQKYYEHDRVETFMYAKTFRKGEKSGNEFRDLWVCNTYVTVETPFPHVYRRNLVISRREEFISPIQNAINMIVSKNSELTLLVEKHSNGMTENVNPFTMTLNGIIDAAVNGGVYNYRDAFFTPKYLAMFPQDEEKLAELRKALSDQEEILEDALSVHKKVCGDGLLALHHKLEQFFAKMKKDLQPMLREVTFKNPLYANEVPEISIWFSRIYGGENM